MNIQKPYKLSNINLDNIVYTNVKQTDRKKVILIKYNDKNKHKNLVFQTPTLLNINIPKLFLDNDIGYGELDIALVGKNSTKAQEFINFITKLEQKVKQDSKDNEKSWFHKGFDSNVKFQNIIRTCPKYNNGMIKVKLIKNHNFETIVQYNNKHKVNMEAIPDNSWIKMLLEVYAIWINPNNDFGIFLRPILVSYTKDDYNYNFTPDSEEEDPQDIPDTEINNNSLFIKMDERPIDYSNDASSILEINSSLLQNSALNALDTSHIDSIKSSDTSSDEKHNNSSEDKLEDKQHNSPEYKLDEQHNSSYDKLDEQYNSSEDKLDKNSTSSNEDEQNSSEEDNKLDENSTSSNEDNIFRDQTQDNFIQNNENDNAVNNEEFDKTHSNDS